MFGIEGDKAISDITLWNSVTLESFALTKSSGANIDDPVTNGEGKDDNKLFTTTDAATDARTLSMSTFVDM